jgi:hypothetical protein
MDIVAGTPARAATGGPAVTSPAFIKHIVAMYTEAQFQSVVGNTSNMLREAMYAQQELPNITNWYSIIANRPLADVIQTVLGLPQSFGAMNVDHQVQVLSSRMNINNFQNPKKVTALLNQFVSMSQLQSTSAAQNPSVQLFNGSTSSDGVIDLTLPTTTLPDSLASNSAIALLQSTASG